jgi:GR25 family glycosyltransferase involved in LPS biosynthesis
MNKIDKIFIINLDKDVERLNSSYKQLNNYNITNYERYQAVNGAESNIYELDTYTTKIGKLIASKSMIGCGISHINIWKRIIKEGINKCLILEDDFILVDNFLNKFNNIIKKSPSEYDILFLSSNIIHNKNLKLYDIDDYFYKQLLISQTVGYIITIEGAKKILKYLNKVSYHIDFELCILSLIQNLNIISVKEALIYQTFDNSNNTDNREYPLLIDKLLIRNDVNYLYKTVLFSIKSLNINISVNTIIIFLLGFYIYPYAIILLLFEYLYKPNKMISNNLILLSIGFLFKILYLKIIL